MRTEIAAPLNYCMYCGDTSTGRFTDEHVIAECFVGHLVYPRSTCDTCSNATSDFEREISRETFWEARAKLKLRRKKKSRRTSQYPEEYPIDITFVDQGPSRTVNVPIEDAPITVLVPHYMPFLQKDGLMRSVCQLRATPLSLDQDKAFASILRKFSAYSATSIARGIKVGTFERLLWKSCYGFLWSICPDSVRSSGIADYVLGKKSPFAQHSDDKNAPLLALNIQSLERDRSDSLEATAIVFSDPSEGNQNIYCDVSFLAAFGLPIYRCQIPNLRRKPIQRTEFKTGQNGWSESSKKAAEISL